MANDGGSSHPHRARPAARPFAGAPGEPGSAGMRPLRPAPVRRATLPPFTHLPAALARLATPKSVAVVAVEATESAEPAPVASAELTVTQVSVPAGVVLDLGTSALPRAADDSVAGAAAPADPWTPPAPVGVHDEPAVEEAPVAPDGSWFAEAEPEVVAEAPGAALDTAAALAADGAAEDVAAMPVAFDEAASAPADVTAFASVDEPNVAQVDEPAGAQEEGAVVAVEQPLPEMAAPAPSLDSELSAFELRDEERVAPPEPIPGLSMDAEAVGVESAAPGEGEAAEVERSDEDGFSAEIAAVTSELRAIHMQEACAEVLEKVAARLRAGQIPAAVSDTRNDAAVLAAVLASLLAQRD